MAYNQNTNTGSYSSNQSMFGVPGYMLGQNRKRVSDGIESQNLVRQQVLQTFQRRQFSTNGISVTCPFHRQLGDKSSTTLSVNIIPHLDGKGRDIPPGFFHCWSCHRSGPWNELAAHVGMMKLEETDNYELNQSAQHVEFEEPYEAPPDKCFREIKPDWDWVRKDSTITNDTLMLAQARMQHYRVNKRGMFIKDRRLWLPVYEFGDLIAHIGAALRDQVPKYLNSSGAWAAAHFYNLDVAVGISESWVARGYKRFCFIVEGPADALMLTQQGLPAVANIGTESWSDVKASLLAMKFETIFPCGDGDKPGRKMNAAIKESLSDILDVHGVRLDAGTDPASLDEDGFEFLKSVAKKHAKIRTRPKKERS